MQKRNTSFIKKLRLLNEDQRESLCLELQQLNLSRYVSEVVNALAEAKLRASDVPTAVAVCSLLHQRYGEFAALLVPSLVTIVAGKPEKEPQRRRTALRLLAGECLLLVVVVVVVVVLFPLLLLALPLLLLFSTSLL